jgi:hypothetical protein
MEKLIALIIARRRAWLDRLRRLAAYLESTKSNSRKGKNR